ALPLVPDEDAVAVALSGKSDSRTLRAGDDNVRIVTKPVLENGVIVGAVQGVRGLGDRESQQRVTLVFTILGIAVGLVTAVPAGLFLASRAMRPIDATFKQQREFVSNASHELRSPLAVIRAQGELIKLLDTPEPSGIGQEAEIVIDEVDEMHRLVDDLLLLAR